EGQVGITKQLQEVVQMFQYKTEKVKNSPSTKKKLIYTTNYIARFVSCAFTNDPSNDLGDYDVEQSSQALAESLDLFFSSCTQTQKIANSHVDSLTVENISEFKENCVLGRSVGLEVLGRLLYLTYDRYNQQFTTEKVIKLAQLDWSRSSFLWEGNIILYQENHNNPAKSYKVSNSSSAVRVAVEKAATASGLNQTQTSSSLDSNSGF
ncbi:MAG: DNA sulfur modification protein DndB, partial [Jaaginema sp. PMC 1079.18]|nr:DNA sulfur modification protein DndB [Jaaginema sp. PMC 1079.18]